MTRILLAIACCYLFNLQVYSQQKHNLPSPPSAVQFSANTHETDPTHSKDISKEAEPTREASAKLHAPEDCPNNRPCKNCLIKRIKKRIKRFKLQENDWDVLKAMPLDYWEYLKEPFTKWGSTEWSWFGGMCATAGTLMLVDENINDYFKRNETKISRDISYNAELVGSQGYIALLTTYSIGALVNDEKLRKTSILALSSFLVSGVLVQGFKKIFGRMRPLYAENGHMDFKPFHSFFSSDRASFPSGHTTSAFAMASCFATAYDSWTVKILAYSIATLAAVSRVHDHRHWASDIFIGGVLGTTTGIFMTNRHLEYTNTESSLGLTPTLLRDPAGGTNLGLSLQYSF